MASHAPTQHSPDVSVALCARQPFKGLLWQNPPSPQDAPLAQDGQGLWKRAAEAAREDDEADGQSASSSFYYGHGPFSEFQDTVHAFAQTHFGCASQDIEVYRMRGGYYNRIVGLNVHSNGQRNEYILRIPRHDNVNIDNEVAILAFLAKETQLPVARVHSFSTATNAVLASPFTVQHRVPGTDLFGIWSTLAFADKARLARDLGHCLKQMMQVQSGTAGRVVTGNPYDRKANPTWTRRTVTGSSSAAGSTEFAIKPLADLGRPRRGTAQNNNQTRLTQSLVDDEQEQPPDPIFFVMVHLLQEQKRKFAERSTTKTDYRIELMDKLCNIVSGMSRFNYFEADKCGSHYKLAHLDIAARNILVDFSTHEPASAITAILDWDDAILAPAFLACNPPVWLWKGGDDDADDTEGYQFTTGTGFFVPKTPEGEKIKQIFDETVGAAYCELAYGEVYRMARRLFYIGTDGLTSNTCCHNADLVLERWRTLYAELRAKEKSGGSIA